MQYRKLAIGLILLLSAVATGCSTVSPLKQQSQAAIQPDRQSDTAQPTQTQSTQFKVRIENISAPDEFTASNGVKWSLGFSPGVWMVHTNTDPLFTVGQPDRAKGLETQSEDGKPEQLAQSLSEQNGILSSGVFNTPVGLLTPGPIRPSEVYEMTISAKPGEQLSLVTMFGQSNDWFYAPEGTGIPLFNAQGNPISGDITSQMRLWNAGTEVDQEPGIGSEQGPRQPADNTGTAEHGVVQPVSDQFAYPETNQVMRITVTPESDRNVGDAERRQNSNTPRPI